MYKLGEHCCTPFRELRIDQKRHVTIALLVRTNEKFKIHFHDAADTLQSHNSTRAKGKQPYDKISRKYLCVPCTIYGVTRRSRLRTFFVLVSLPRVIQFFWRWMEDVFPVVPFAMKSFFLRWIVPTLELCNYFRNATLSYEKFLFFYASYFSSVYPKRMQSSILAGNRPTRSSWCSCEKHPAFWFGGKKCN